MENKAKRYLIIFDFSDTIAIGNTDLQVANTLPDKKIPQYILDQNQPKQWNKWIQLVYNYLRDQKISIEQIKKSICDIQFVAGMKELLEYLKIKKDFIDVMIVSDTNNIFLEWFLENNQIQDCINKIYVNPASIEDNQLIQLKALQSNSCKICPPNLCKSLCIKEFIDEQLKKQINYDIKMYAGDGENDFCPMGNLESQDYAFPRKGYKVESKIHESKENEIAIKAKIQYWNDGVDLKQFIENILN